jgi:hypothetical protein
MSGIYKGTITITDIGESPNVPIYIVFDNADKTISLTIPEGTIIPIEIKATCPATIDGDKYLFTGTASIPFLENEEITIIIENSSITRAGKAEIKMKIVFPEGVLPEEIEPGVTLNYIFNGEKR